MSKRCVWVVELNVYDNVWEVWSVCDTREEARIVKKDSFHPSDHVTRVVKYVPAESGKKGGVK